MADDDYGLNAYLDIQKELGAWGEATPASTPRRQSPGLRRYYDASPSPPAATPATPARDGLLGNDEEEEDVFSPSLRSPEARRGGVGVQTPEPAGGHATAAVEDGPDEAMDDAGFDDGAADDQFVMEEGTDPCRPYHDALFAYLQGRERLLHLTAHDGDVSRMRTDDDDAEAAQAHAAVDDAEVTFLGTLASVCLSRGQGGAGHDSDEDNNWEASTNEGNLWDLLAALRTAGLPSLFYGVNEEDVPELTLAHDPAALPDRAPAEALDACLGGGEGHASLPLQRLHAAVGWIEACHGRRFEEALTKEYEGSDDPLLPPPRRRTMRPGTVAALQKRPKAQSAGAFHPDAPVLAPEDETDDARLLRACFRLVQSGRLAEATQLVADCGQPWLAAAWTGGRPLSSDGTGNPARGLWKRQCRRIGDTMARQANTEVSSMDDTGGRGLYPAVAYEAAILSLLADDVDAALTNPVFKTWEDGVHAVLRAEWGIIEDDVLRSHNGARAAAAKKGGGHFPHPGTEFDVDDGDAPRENDGDLGAALQTLEASPVPCVRDGAADPFRNGMASFLAGHTALPEFLEECGALALEGDTNDDDAGFVRFVVHLVLYVDTVVPDFCARLALPPGRDGATDDGMYSLRELLVLKYVAYLSSRRALWSHVALYASLLSQDNILDTYASFLVHVHGHRERQRTLKQARDLFPPGFDCYILRNVVRGMILSDRDEWTRAPGEEAAPAGVAPADARMMRAIHWLCYYPEHRPDALVTANMLLRRFLLAASVDAIERDLYAPKVFMEKILPKDMIEVAKEQSQKEGGALAGSISFPMLQNLEAEYLSIGNYLKAHTKYVQFLDAIAQTSPCHQSNRLVDGSQSKHETEIANKMERNAFRQKKMGLSKIVIESASRATDALMEVLTFAGGWLVDVNSDLGDEDTETDEARARSEELEAIRAKYVPRAVFMLEEVLRKTALWLEQVAYDAIDQFGDASHDMLIALFGSFDESYRSNDDLNVDILTTSTAAPGYWHKKSLSLASVVANDVNGLHETFRADEMDSFLKLMAEANIKLSLSVSLVNVP